MLSPEGDSQPWETRLQLSQLLKRHGAQLCQPLHLECRGLGGDGDSAPCLGHARSAQHHGQASVQLGSSSWHGCWCPLQPSKSPWLCRRWHGVPRRDTTGRCHHRRLCRMHEGGGTGSVLSGELLPPLPGRERGSSWAQGRRGRLGCPGRRRGMGLGVGRALQCDTGT